MPEGPEEEELDPEEQREKIQKEAEEIRQGEDDFEDDLPEKEPGTKGGPSLRDEKDSDDPVEDMLR
ncbi:MAG: hypothetical protein ABEK01_02815 [Candidatus Nanohaloarchaea archaeon]